MSAIKQSSVKVPSSLLRDPTLSSSAKYLWMILQVCSRSGPASVPTSLLADRSGLARHTVRSGLEQLKKYRSAPSDSSVWIPDDLLLDRRIPFTSKLLYAMLQLTYGKSGEFTYADLSGATGSSPPTLRRSLQPLATSGWLRLQQRTKFCPVAFEIPDFAAEASQTAVQQARRRINAAPFKGEAIMREYLTLLIDCDEFDDDVSPGFLVNPFTGEEMEYDRYYPPRVAFEFMGRQHYGPTEHYPDEAEARRQRGRDHLKRGISEDRGITLVVVHPDDLTLQTMRKKAEGLLPSRSLIGQQPLIRYLETVSRRYRLKSSS